MSAPVAESWITKQEAAELLGVSIRQVERLAARGLIRKRYLKPGEGRKYGCTQFQRAAVVSIDREREQALVKTASDSATSVAVVPVGQSQATAWSALAEHLAKLSAAYPTPKREWPAWLTFEEAWEYSGLTAPYLEGFLRDGLIHCIGRGRKTWRIQRASLDAYGQAAHQ